MPDQRPQLTVLLERSGHQLRVTYYDVKAQRLGETATVPWSAIGAGLLYAHNGSSLAGLDAINAALEQGLAEDLATYFTQGRLVEVGHIFFTVLFGNSDRWEPILRALFDEHGDPRPNPPRRSVRVRICTTDNDLVDLPWRLAAWKGRFLADSGWTFEVVTDVRAGRDVEFETPCPVLVIAPEVPGLADINTHEHLESLRQSLPPQYITPSYFRVVRTRNEVRDAFRGMRPRVLYYYGHAEIRGGQLCLLLGDEDAGAEAINANDLRLLMDGYHPHLAYINACKSGASGWHSVGYQLSPEVPVVIANATTAWSAHASRSAVAFLTRCLEHGHDPVVAAHDVDEHVTTRGFEWGMRTIHANYGSWRAQPLARLGPITPIGLRLDRDRSRERAFGRVTSLVRSDEQRVMAFVSYARVGNRIDLSWQQLKDHLEDHAAHLAHVSWRSVLFPVERPVTSAALQRELAVALGAPPSEPVEYALRRTARGLGVGSAMPVLWLNWGVFGRRHGHVLGQTELETWVQYCNYLAHHTPADIRLVGYLALETASAPHPQLEALVNQLALVYLADQTFSVELIPPLKEITLLDIALFLQDRNNTRCPPSLVQEMARLLHERARGHFEETLALIERAEREGWYSMRRELRPPEPTGNFVSAFE